MPRSPRRQPRARRGFSLVEQMVALVVVAIFGSAAVKLFASQVRFMDQQRKARSARYISRQSLTLLLSELRMVEATGGVIAVGPTSMTLRVPFAIGVVCSTNPAGTTLSMLPADMYGSSAPSGYAWRAGAGNYAYDESGVGANVSPGSSSDCAAQGISVPPNGNVTQISPALASSVPIAAPIMLFQRVRYEFRQSAAVPGRIGLWRTGLKTGVSEELAAPFDSTSQFRYFLVNSDTSIVTTAPYNIVGVDLTLNGASELPRWGASKPEVSSFRTAVFFGNRQQ